MVDARAAQRAGCKFRKTGNLVWLTSQPIPNRAILRYEAWDDLPQQAGSSSSKVKAEEGLWEPKQELWVNQEDPNMPVEIIHTVAEVAKTLSEAAADVPDGSHIKVDPATFEVEVCEGPQKDPGQESEGEAEECDWEASSSDEAEVVQAVPAKAGVEERLPQKMEIEEEDEPRPRRKKLQLGSAQILLLQAVGDADAANWSSLQQCIQSHNSSGDHKSDLLKRLEQLADLRQESREGAIQALQAERDRAWRISRAENMYREGLDQEMARLEKNNPVGPRVGEPMITDARLKADIAAGVGIWRARRDHRARERAARHRKANPAAPPTGEGYLMDVDPNEGGRALDEAMTNRDDGSWGSPAPHTSEGLFSAEED